MRRAAWALALAAALSVALGPVLYMVAASLAGGSGFNAGVRDLSVGAYVAVLSSPTAVRSIALTAGISSGASLLTVALATPAAYALARTRSPWCAWASNSLLLAWLVPQVFSALAFFSVAVKLGFYQKPALMVFFGVLQSVPLSVWVLRSFIATVPREIDEAAVTDGASLARFLRQVLLPVSAPSVAAVAGYSFLITWQLYLYPLVYLAGRREQMVSVGVQMFVGEWSTNYPQMMAYSTLITAPLVAVFLLVQKYIVSGVAAGAVNE
jgi:ABC-type glycerol-3-phosphate transport system permease component